MIKHVMRLTASAIAIAAVIHDNKAGWKLSADGKTIEMKDGNPVWIDTNGNESTLAQDSVARLNNESRQHRERADDLSTKLKAFEKITDPAAALKAVEDMKKIDQKKLIDAGEVDKVRDEITKQFQTANDELKRSNSELQTRLNTMMIGDVFKSSEFVRDRVAMPSDIFQDSFSKHFKVNDKGEVEAYGRDGNRLMSKAKIGDYASPSEAIELLVEQHPSKDMLLKPNTGGGTGNGGGGGRVGGSNTMKRTAFDALSPTEQALVGQRQAKGEITLVD